MSMAIYGAFKVSDVITLDQATFLAARNLRKDLYLIAFTIGSMEDPDVDPLLMYMSDGRRIYLWQGAEYGEVLIDYRRLWADVKTKDASFKGQFLSLLTLYRLGSTPSLISTTADVTYCRVLYKLNHVTSRSLKEH